MSVHCFSVADDVLRSAHAAGEVRWHGPARFGSLERLGLGPGDTVVLIDGCPPGERPLLHKELLAEIAAGVRVIGGGGAGALRAAETEPFGMEGTGTVFRAFRRGVLIDDDEVIRTAADAGDAPLVPLVNVRATARDLARRGQISRPARAALVAAATALPWHRRRWDAIIAAAEAGGITAAEGERIRHGEVDLIAQDAAAALDLAFAESPASPPAFAFADTLAWHDLHAGVVPASVPAAFRLTAAQALPAVQALAVDFPRLYHHVAIRTLLLTAESRPQPWCACHRHGVSLTERLTAAEQQVVAEMDAAVAAQIGESATEETLELALVETASRLEALPAAATAFSPDIEARWLSEAELAELSEPHRTACVLVRAIRLSPHVPMRRNLVLELKRRGAFGAALTMLQQVEEFNQHLAERQRRHVPDLVPDGDVLSWFVQRWGGGRPEVRWSERGYTSQASAIESARRIYLFDRLRPSQPWYLEPDG